MGNADVKLYSNFVTINLKEHGLGSWDENEHLQPGRRVDVEVETEDQVGKNKRVLMRMSDYWIPVNASCENYIYMYQPLISENEDIKFKHLISVRAYSAICRGPGSPLDCLGPMVDFVRGTEGGGLIEVTRWKPYYLANAWNEVWTYHPDSIELERNGKTTKMARNPVSFALPTKCLREGHWNRTSK